MCYIVSAAHDHGNFKDIVLHMQVCDVMKGKETMAAETILAYPWSSHSM